MIQEKVRKHFPEKKEEEVQALSTELSNQAEILKKFKHLLSYADNVVDNIAEENLLMSDFHSLEREKAHDRAKHGVASICHLPVKLRISKLQRTWALSHTFTALLRYEYGPLHAALEVGNITVEWGRESLVVPSYAPSGTFFSAHVHDQGEWFDETYKLVKDMSLADRCKDRRRKIEILNNSAEKKEELLKKLADVIIDYNCNKKYSVYSCNCQHFVLDALAALGIKEPPEFSGRLKDYLQTLKKGKAHATSDFQTHEQLDEHVAKKLADMTTHDAEYLLCQYFQFHLPSIEASEDEDTWQCDAPNCQCKALEEWVQDHTLLLNQFLKENTPQTPAAVSRPPAFSPIPEEAEYEWEEPQDNVGQVPNQQNGFLNHETNDGPGVQRLNGDGVVGEEVEDADERLAREEAGDTDQHELLTHFTGFSKRISDKISAKFADKTKMEQTELAEMLTSEEKLRANYFAGIVEGTAEALTLSASNDYKRVKNLQLPPSQARQHSDERLQTISSLSMKLLLRTHPVRGQGPILDDPLQAYLQIENLTLQWNDSSLVVPSEASTLLGSQPIYKASLHLSEWSAFVNKQEPRRQLAIDNRDHGLEVELIYELTKKRDTLISSLIRVIVEYNRNKQYNNRRCNNQHFIKDVCRAVGIKPFPEICTTFKQQLSKLKPSRRMRRNFATHQELDTFVREEIQNGSVASYKSYDLDFLIGQYLRFHITSWDESQDPQGQRKCQVDNCQLEELEKLKPSFESGRCVLL